MKRHLPIRGVLTAALVALASTAHAAVSYRFVAEQPGYTVNVDQTQVLPVKIYLQEELTGGSTSDIVADNGIFSLAVLVSRSSGTATLLNQIDAAPGFDGTVTKNFGATVASLYEDQLSFSGPGPMPDTNGRLYIGTFHLDVGSVAGVTSTFDLLDYQAGTDQIATYGFRALDSSTSPGSFSVVTVVPEPAVGTLIVGAAITLLVRGRRRAAR